VRGLRPALRGDKLLAPLADGTPVAVASARTLVAALLGRAVAVLRPGQQALQSALAGTGIELLSSAAAVEGMGAALAAAVQAHAQAPGWVVALGDMPCVAEATVRRVASALAHDDALAAPFHQGRGGIRWALAGTGGPSWPPGRRRGRPGPAASAGRADHAHRRGRPGLPAGCGHAAGPGRPARARG
jgi:hypothetical protein